MSCLMKKQLQYGHYRLLLVISLVHVLHANRAPQIQVIPGPTVIDIFENAPIGTVIGRLIATDQDNDPVTFSITDVTTKELVRLGQPTGDSATGVTVEIILNSILDSDYSQRDKTLLISCTDGFLTNPLQIRIQLFIKDINDELPEFRPLRYKVSVFENATIGTIVTKVTAHDPDKGLGGIITYSMQPQPKSDDPDYNSAFKINPEIGDIIVNGSLDYEKYNYYEFAIDAIDHFGLKNTDSADLIITLIDVQDTAPTFINQPYTVSIKENVTVGEAILQVTAIDGDGVRNDIAYTFVGDHSNFDIDSSGWITVTTSLNRDDEAVRQRGGVYELYVEASEILFPETTNYGDTTVTTLVTVRVQDINDNMPVFNYQQFDANINENAQRGVPITFTGNKIMTVKDADQGENSHFVLSVEKNNQPYTDFTTIPSEVFSESSIQIQVNNSGVLNYEVNNITVFQIVAREVDTPERRSSTATVTLHIKDVNDNQPIFSSPSYIAQVPENSPVGTSVIQLEATDADSGQNGEISYSIRGGNNRFAVDETSGLVTVQGSLDREKIDVYYITAEARDHGGFRTSIEVEIIVIDQNDNAPQFHRKEYYGSIKENESSFIRPPLQVDAADIDEPGTVNSEVKYEIAAAPLDLISNFTIDSVTGEITVIEPLDYEKLNPVFHGKVVLEVAAHDLGNPQMKSLVNVTLDVEDVNDNPPLFDDVKYFTSIPENATGGTEVMQVHAVDADGTEANNEFLYRINSGAQDKFRIRPENGEIAVENGAVLNREDKNMYILNISVMDKGTNSLTSYSVVVINITDVNDEMPFFTEQTRTVSINESTSINQPVTTYSAKDVDLGNHLQYSIIQDSTKAFDGMGQPVDVQSSGIKNNFGIQRETGEVYVKSALDREIAEQIVLELLVTDTNAWKPAEQTATGTLTIILMDVNDNSPNFQPTSTYHASMPENQEANTDIIRVTATDKDKNQNITYAIIPGPTDNFLIDMISGQIRLREKLDYEEIHAVTLNIIASDGDANFPRTSTATVFIEVLDVNDNQPVFVQHSNTYYVPENSPNETVVATLTATDNDTNALGHVWYRMEVTDDDGKLSINSDTGEIIVTGQLNRESREFYFINIIAGDNKGVPENQKSAQIFLKIVVQDENDNQPFITNIYDDTRPVVLENAEAGYEVFNVEAEDLDEGDNAIFEFSLTGATNMTEMWFEIDASTGKITVAPDGVGLLKYGLYFMTVQVSDKGDPTKMDSKIFYLFVQDINSHDPIFTNPPGSPYTIQRREEEPPGTKIIQLIAEDADHGANAEVRFLLESIDDWEKFELDTTGLLTNKVTLDREVQQTYRLQIKSYDRGIPPRDSDLTLTINLLDINDKDPEFERVDGMKPLLFTVDENVQSAMIGSVDRAIDKDSNATICYYILGGGRLDHFLLEEAGELFLLNEFDRELTSFVNLVVWATSQCGQTMSAPIGFESLLSQSTPPQGYYPHNHTLLWVQVIIRDVNDNSPIFRRKVISKGVTRDTQFGTVIINLQEEVIDKDIGNNSVSIFNKTHLDIHIKPENVLGTGGNARQPFILFSNGTLKTNIYFQSNMFGYFSMKVHVQNINTEPGAGDNAVLRISLINDNQRVKVIFRRTPEEVRNLTVIFLERLENITGFRIVMDKIQTHENADGSAGEDKTDMFIHAEDRETNEVIASDILLKAIDTHGGVILTNIMNRYNILEIVPTGSPDEGSKEVEQLTMAVILVAILLAIPCLLLAVILYTVHKKYKRKLKAASAMSYVHRGTGSEKVDLQKMELPNTNQYAYENSNPIFREKVQMNETEYDGDHDSLDHNDVGLEQVNHYDEQEASMSFFNERHTNVPEIPREMITPSYLHAALNHHEHYKHNYENISDSPLNGNIRVVDGKADNKTEPNFMEGLQTTEI